MSIFLTRRELTTVWTKVFGGDLRMIDQLLERCLGIKRFLFHGIRCYSFANRIDVYREPLPSGAFECPVNAQTLQGIICVPAQEATAFSQKVGASEGPQEVSVILWEGTEGEGIVSMRLVQNSSRLRLLAPTFSLAAICFRRLYPKWAKALAMHGVLPESLSSYRTHMR